MVFRGALDFGSGVAGAARLYRVWQSEAGFAALPVGLRAAARADGSPDLILELVRGPNPMSGPQPYGVLDVRLETVSALEQALPPARLIEAGAQVDAAPPEFGWLRLRAGGELLLPPAPMAGSGVGALRTTVRLSDNGAALLHAALLKEALLVEAVAELRFSGVSPRAEAAVRFDPEILLARLLAQSKAGVLAWDAIVSRFASLPPEVNVLGTVDQLNRVAFGEAMADRVAARFGRLVPSVEQDCRMCVHLELSGPGHFDWDLREPFLAQRLFPVTFDAFDAVRRSGAASAVRHTVTQPVQSGYLLAEVAANLPRERPGVLSCGVHLNAAPKLPWRPQAINESVEFNPPEDRARVLLRFAPNEPPRFLLRAFAVIEETTGIRMLEGPEREVEGPDARLTVDDFPVRFLPLEISPQLAELAEVEAVVGQVRAAFPRGVLQTTLVLPREADPLVRWTATRNEQRLIVEGGQRLDLTRFAGYGLNTVSVEVAFAPGDPAVVALDLMPEASSVVTTLAFTPARPKREWAWFADSPFAPGYRYRVFDANGSRPWSPIQPPGAALQLEARRLS